VLRSILNFFRITDVNFVRADDMALGPNHEAHSGRIGHPVRDNAHIHPQ
jgi:hypothetical protein